MYKDNKKCVWMTSGLVSYKLCAFDFLCEDCIFDKAMRNEATVEDRTASCLSTALKPCNENSMHIMDDFFYHQNHCWVKVENADCVRIGIDSILAKLINQIKTIVLPQPGEIISQGQYFCHIIQQRHILPLTSPLNGIITSVNYQIEKTPELVINNFWENGWMVTIKPENLEHDLQSLIFGRKAIEWHKNKNREIIDLYYAMINKNENIPGVTMQDGGEIIPDFVDELNAEQYYQILESLSRTENTKN